MKPLLDADVLRMEIGSVGQHVNEDGETVMRSFNFVSELLDAKIREISELVWADEPPTLYLTSCPRTHNILHKRDSAEFKTNFRFDIATVKPYKGTRKGEKPLHYDNITAYMLNCYDCVVAEGMEADDLLAIAQTTALREGRETIICTRDKDLRMVEGNQFGWECGKQAGYGPKLVSETDGYRSFCSQLLTGDTVDNIPGLKGVGPVKAAAILEGKETYREMLEAVREAYRASYGHAWAPQMTEQAQLLWMVRELKDGKPVMWRMPEYLYES